MGKGKSPIPGILIWCDGLCLYLYELIHRIVNGELIRITTLLKCDLCLASLEGFLLFNSGNCGLRGGIWFASLFSLGSKRPGHFNRELSVEANLHNYAAFIDWKCIFVASVALVPSARRFWLSTHPVIIALLEYHPCAPRRIPKTGDKSGDAMKRTNFNGMGCTIGTPKVLRPKSLRQLLIIISTGRMINGPMS